LPSGRREIARLWGCDERTVKREMAKLRAGGWLTVRRQGARGRVTEYALAIDRVLKTRGPVWGAVGPDFELRMEGAPEPTVVPLPVRGEVPAPDLSDGPRMGAGAGPGPCRGPGLYAAWVRALRRADRAGGRLTLSAPSRFHAAYVETHLKGRLLAAVQAVDGDVSEIVVTG
jgi:hypothetical protein